MAVRGIHQRNGVALLISDHQRLAIGSEPRRHRRFAHAKQRNLASRLQIDDRN